jgi:signal transduction histidine kinase
VNAVAAADVVSTLAFGLALLFAVLIPVPADRPYLRPIKAFMTLAMGLYLFVGVSNVLEWGGITPALDVYEDYAEVLFVPALAYVLFSLASAQQFESTRRTEQLVRSEQELLSSVVAASPAGIMVVQPDGSVTIANEVAQKVLGLGPENGTTRHQVPLDVLLGPEAGGVSGLRDGLRELARMGAVDDLVRYVERPGGAISALDFGVRPLGREGSEGSVVAFVDVTERLRYGEDLEHAVDIRTRELIEANRQLAVANDAKRDFLARLSHELRTPLNAVTGFSSTLLQGQAGEISGEQRRQLEMIRTAGNSLTSLVSDVLDIALIETGRASIAVGGADACEIARAVVEMIRPMASDKGVDLEVDCPDGAVLLQTDADKLAQIMRNYVNNAVKYSDRGAWVRVIVAREANAVRVSVADSGIGIPEDELPHVFEAFRTGEGSDRAEAAGAGLGLAICRDLARLLGGHVEVESELGRGSTFSVVLPAEEVPDQYDSTQTS